MSKRKKWQAGVICVVVMALLAPAALAEDFVGGGPYTVDYTITPDNEGNVKVQDATVNLESGSSLASGAFMQAFDGAVVNINDCSFPAGTALAVADNAEVNVFYASFDPSALLLVSTHTELHNADVTIHGANFKIDGVDATEEVLPNGALFENGKYYLPYNVVTVLDGNGNSLFDVTVACIETLFPEGYVRTYVSLGGNDGPLEVTIDIKPDSSDNTVNLGSMGVIPVGILSTADFDATQVDPWEVNLAGADVAVRGKGSKLLSSIKDLNGDGLLDLEVKVETENLDPGEFQDGAAILTGLTYDGLEIQGSDSITIVPVE